jgi:hypothetical protein
VSAGNGVKPGRNGKKTTLKTPTMPGKHGGTLRRGGTNKGGPGRPPAAVREACAKSFDARVPVLERIADDTKATSRDRMMAMDLLGKYGGLLKAEISGTLGIDGLLNDLDRTADDPE